MQVEHAHCHISKVIYIQWGFFDIGLFVRHEVFLDVGFGSGFGSGFDSENVNVIIKKKIIII